MVEQGARRQAGRPPRISREDIIDAVLKLGLDNATVSAVAAHLQVDPSTLYGHVANRDDMLGAAADAALNRVAWPYQALSDWRTFLEAVADALWELYSEVPGLAAHLRSMRNAPPALLTRSAQIVQTLCEEFGISVHDAALTVDTIADSVTDSFLFIMQLDTPSPASSDGTVSRDMALAALSDENAPEHTDYTQILRDALGTAGEPSNWWRQKVQLVLDGLTYRLQTEPS